MKLLNESWNDGWKVECCSVEVVMNCSECEHDEYCSGEGCMKFIVYQE